MKSRTLLAFYLGKDLFGIEITKVKEINRNVEFTPVPEASPNVAGLFNMRGQIVTLLDLTKILKGECCEEKGRTACIILKTTPNNLDYAGFIIDKPKDVISIKEEWCESVPANLDDIESEYLKEIVKLEDELIMVIDPEKILIKE